MKKQISFENNAKPIALIAIVDDVNISTPLVYVPVAASIGDDFDKDDILDYFLAGKIAILRQIRKFSVLNQMVELAEENSEFDYKFTKEQKDVLEKEYASYLELTDDELKINKLLQYIKTCNKCSTPLVRKSPYTYKNFAEYHDLDLSPKDYLAILKKLERSNFQGFTRSKYRTFLGDKIYQFCREDDYVDAKGLPIGHYNIWVEINLRLTYEGDVIALISLHDAEFKALPG